MDTVKARRKCLGSLFCREVNSHEDSIFAMIVFVPRGLVPICIKPFAHRRHPSGKLGGA